MGFLLKGFGRSGKAEIRIDGLAVITGSNGSGKGTISRALYTCVCLCPGFSPK